MANDNGPAGDSGLKETLLALGRKARRAFCDLGLATAETRTAAIEGMASALEERKAEILAANVRDVAAARGQGRTEAFVDRLTLDGQRLEALAQSMSAIARLPDPVGSTIASWSRPNGLQIARVRVPIGVIGIIYESRPNVTGDAGALCVRSGNASILRCGAECLATSTEIHAALCAGLRGAGLPEAAISLVPSSDRQAVDLMLQGLGGTIDLIVPRGGKSLVAKVESDARVPVFAHLEGICHTYVDRDADLAMATAIVVNAKMRRTGVCGATETLLVDRAAPAGVLKALVEALIAAGCEVRGDELAQAVSPRVKPASEENWRTEYLDAIIAVRVVEGVEGAIRHIERYGSHHTDAIITRNEAAALRFLGEVDSAIVLHNASTQFADGGEFGMGAEIGIATGRLHARGPVGAEQLTTFKYVVRGNGQVRS